MNEKVVFPESRYLSKVSIDFEDLPHYIIQKGIIWKFEKGNFRQEQAYTDWKQGLLQFLDTIPETHRVKFLQKGIEYANVVYKYHLDKECTNKSNCPDNQSWERRIAIAKNMLHEIPGDKKAANQPNDAHSNKGKNYQSQLPILPLSEHERIWLERVYEQTKEGLPISFKAIWTKLHDQLPTDFRPALIDERLISFNGEEIRLLGVIALEKNYKIVETINRVIFAIRDLILKDHEK
ncbi:MAG: hypothetical protein WCF67_01000, partial [Chitinophagaceae bacterium]